MTTESTKKRTVNRNAALSATQAADRIAAELGALPARVKERLAVLEAEERQDSHNRILAWMARVPDSERDKVAKVLIALGCELSGIELQPTNDTAPAEGGGEARPEWLDEAPKGAPPLAVIDRDERRVGKGRGTSG